VETQTQLSLARSLAHLTTKVRCHTRDKTSAVFLTECLRGLISGDIQRMILKYDKLLFRFACNLNSRPCSSASRAFQFKYLSAWACAAGGSRNLRGRLIKLVQRWGQIRESTAFERWVDWVEELELMRGHDRHALQQLARVHIARAIGYSPSHIARLVIQRI
jgi:hypothetical protein